MTRTLRYPRLCAVVCAVTLICALLRDLCLSHSLFGYARVLLCATVFFLPLCLILTSCRIVVDAQGVSVGALLRMRRISWQDISALGVLYCNSKRRYLYGMYRGHSDFLNLLHRAPVCGPWGFVVPLGNTLLQAVCRHCPFEIDLSPLSVSKPESRLRVQWRYAALNMLLLPVCALAFFSGAMLIPAAAQTNSFSVCFFLTGFASVLFIAGLSLISRALNIAATCPAFNESGIRAGAGLYLPWEDVRFGYVHRIAHMSGFYLLSRPHDDMKRRGAPPVLCLSMPDTSTLLLAYLTYCPHAEKGVER